MICSEKGWEGRVKGHFGKCGIKITGWGENTWRGSLEGNRGKMEESDLEALKRHFIGKGHLKSFSLKEKKLRIFFVCFACVP